MKWIHTHMKFLLLCMVSVALGFVVVKLCFLPSQAFIPTPLESTSIVEKTTPSAPYACEDIALLKQKLVDERKRLNKVLKELRSGVLNNTFEQVAYKSLAGLPRSSLLSLVEVSSPFNQAMLEKIDDMPQFALDIYQFMSKPHPTNTEQANTSGFSADFVRLNQHVNLLFQQETIQNASLPHVSRSVKATMHLNGLHHENVLLKWYKVENYKLLKMSVLDVQLEANNQTITLPLDESIADEEYRLEIFSADENLNLLGRAQFFDRTN